MLCVVVAWLVINVCVLLPWGIIGYMSALACGLGHMLHPYSDVTADIVGFPGTTPFFQQPYLRPVGQRPLLCS